MRLKNALKSGHTMRHINIFVAGSKKLMNYREKLVLWANDKNYAYRRRNEDLQINVYSFKEVGDDQDVYNEVITKKSDIIIFLIEKSLGARTKEELEQAKAGFRKRNRPQIWVFTNRADNTTKTYLEGSLGRRYGIDFSSPEELINGANKRLEDYLKEMEKSPESRKKNFFLALKKWIVPALVCFMILLAGMCGGRYYADSKPKVVIAGGGSVANFIEDRSDSVFFKMVKGGDVFYLHLPSKNAWDLLKEEVVSKQLVRRYYPICISASEAVDSDFCISTNTPENFRKEGIVVACNIGSDSLVVYIQKDSTFWNKNKSRLQNGSISVDTLKAWIMNQTMNVYATSPESGTRDGYRRVLGLEEEELGKYVAGVFSETSTDETIKKGNKPFLLLGSKYYQMKSVKDEVKPLIVNTDFIKPMIVYFVAERKVLDLEGDVYQVPQEIIEFLHVLRYTELDKYISNNRTLKIKKINSARVIFGKEDFKPNVSR